MAKSNRHTVPIVIALICLAWAAMKLSLPALPILSAVFHTSTNNLKLSISLMIAFVALSQLFWGAISDNIGRKSVALIAMGIAIYGTIVVISAHNIVMFILGRCVEGIGVGGFSPVGRAIFTDCFDRKTLIRLLAIFSGMAGLMPFIAPVVGGFILFSLNWRYIFIFFIVLLIIAFLWTFFCLKETHQTALRKNPIRHAIKAYSGIVRESKFWGFAICYMLCTGTILGYYAAMPFWYVTTWHIPEQYYAFLALSTVLMNLAGLMLSRRLAQKIALEKIIWCILWGIALLALLTTTIDLFLPLSPLLKLIALPIIFSLYGLCVGMMYPCANAGLNRALPQFAGMVSALATTCMFLTAAGMSWLESHFDVHNLHQISILLCSNAVIMLMAFFWLVHRKNH